MLSFELTYILSGFERALRRGPESRAVTFRSTPMVAPGETGHVHVIEGGACGPLKTASEDLATHGSSMSYPDLGQAQHDKGQASCSTRAPMGTTFRTRAVRSPSSFHRPSSSVGAAVPKWHHQK